MDKRTRVRLAVKALGVVLAAAGLVLALGGHWQAAAALGGAAYLCVSGN